MSTDPKHLWEVDHPYYGADGTEQECDSFAELRAIIDGADEDMNHVYRWDWVDDSQHHRDELFTEGEYRGKQEFKVFCVLPRKSRFWIVSCPITHEQEPEVIEWLRSQRVLGSLRVLWEPILDLPAVEQPIRFVWRASGNPVADGRLMSPAECRAYAALHWGHATVQPDSSIRVMALDWDQPMFLRADEQPDAQATQEAGR